MKSAMGSKEQRWSKRRHIQFDVTLYPHVGSPIPATAQDVSIGGIYVATHAQLPAIDTPVAVGFRFGEGGDDNYYRMSAVVVRSNDKGAGLMFEAYDDGTVESLRRVYDKTAL